MANYNTIAEFEAALKRAKDGLNTAIESAMRKHGQPFAETIKNRVSSTGTDSTGKPFSTPYSRSHAYKRKKHGKGSFGTQTSYKGFFYQGTMWANFKLLSVSNTNANVNAKLGFVGGNAYTTNEKLNEIHSSREGIQIAAPTPDEARELVRKVGFEIGEYLKSAL